MGKELFARFSLICLCAAYFSEDPRTTAKKIAHAGVREGKSTKENNNNAPHAKNVQTVTDLDRRFRLKASNGPVINKATPTTPVSAKYWNQSL